MQILLHAALPSYPFRKEKSDYDYGFSDGVSDKYYLGKIKYEIPKLIEDFEPDFIFYLSGVDIIENDKLGRLSVSINGCKERDHYVLNFELKVNRESTRTITIPRLRWKN